MARLLKAIREKGFSDDENSKRKIAKWKPKEESSEDEMMPFLFFSKHLLHSSPFYSCCVFVFSHFHFLRVEGVFLILRERHTHPLHDEITELTRRHRRERNTLQEITRSEIYYVLSSKMDKIGVFPPPFTYTVLLIFELAFNRCCQTVQFSCFLHFLYTNSLYFLRDEASKRILQ